MRAPRRGLALTLSALLVALSLAAACQEIYPEVVIVNQTSPDLLIRDPSFSGCRWSTVLAYGEATSVGRCLPGSDRVHFQKLGLTAAAQDREAGTATTWFGYQTITAHTVDYGEYRIIELTLEDLEQDFSVPGPYGH